MSDLPPPPPPPPPGPMGGPPPPPQLGLPRPAELFDRFLARLIDGVGFLIVYGILYGILASIFLRGYSSSVGEILLFAIFLNILGTMVYIGYYAYFESTKGATFGKQLMKLKVVGPDGVNHPTMEQAVKRNAFQAISLIGIIPFIGRFFGPLLSLAAVIFIAVGINNDTVARRGWHDNFAGGTTVLKIG